MISPWTGRLRFGLLGMDGFPWGDGELVLMDVVAEVWILPTLMAGTFSRRAAMDWAEGRSDYLVGTDIAITENAGYLFLMRRNGPALHITVDVRTWLREQ